MKILSLSGENLASLTGQFTTDFAGGALGAAGLFAITGNTGAGCHLSGALRRDAALYRQSQECRRSGPHG